MAANSDKIKKTMKKINESTQPSEVEKLELEVKNVISEEFETIAQELKSLTVKVDQIVTLKEYLETAKSNAQEQMLEFVATPYLKQIHTSTWVSAIIESVRFGIRRPGINH